MPRQPATGLAHRSTRPHRVSVRLIRGLLAALSATTALSVTAALAGPAGAVTAAPGAAPTPAPGGIGLRLVDAPVDAREDPRARVYIVDHLAPATVISRRIEVSNTTAAAARIALYPAAASITDGSFLGAAGNTPNDLSTWTSVTPGQVDVPANGTATATVRIAVAADAAPGEQYGVVWAEARSAPVEGAGVTQISRVGIRLYVSVGPGGAPAADFTIDSLAAGRAPDGSPTVRATVHNSGGRALDMNGSLQLLAGPGGLSAGPFPASLGTTLAIDGTAPVTIALDNQLPAGPWDARITLKSGLVERSVQATITFPATGTAPPVTTTAPAPGRPYPATTALLALLALLLLAVAALLTTHRRRRRSATADQVPGSDRDPLPVPR